MMKILVKIALLGSISGVFLGCVPAPKPQIGIGLGGLISQQVKRVSNSLPVAENRVVDREYGAKPLHYMNAIRSYFTNKIPRGGLSKYKYGEPKRAYKKEGFAFGGDISWRGWLVETSIATPTRTGRLLTPKPYMVLFSGEQIVEHILGYSHKLITKVDP